MSKLSLLVHLNSYSDSVSTNSPNMNNFKWTRSLNSLTSSNPLSESISLAPGESKNIFNGTRTLNSDNTTTYSVSLKPITSNTYVIQNTSGTAPNFRTPRSIGLDATSQITVSTNGPLTIFTSTGGTLINTTSVVIGDQVRIGSLFNVSNQGSFKIIAKSSTSITIENQIGVSEGPITLGAGFLSQFSIYSASGIQIGDSLVISSGFSSASFGTYKITDVSAESIEFYSTSILPSETGITNPGLNIYSSAKSLIYIESDKNTQVTINGSLSSSIEPFIENTTIYPGIFLLKSTVYSLSLLNNSLDTSSVFIATVE